MRDVGTFRPQPSTVCLKSSRSSARWIASIRAPISSIPSSREHARGVELARKVQRGAAAHRRQQRIRAFTAEHAGDAFEIERLEVRPIGEARGRS